MSSERVPPAMYAPMPELGTIRECVFCHFMVTLRPVQGGWHHWLADRDRPDRRWHCDGGEPGNDHLPAVRTLHIPVPPPDGAPWAPRYDPDGVGHHPQG